MSSFTKSGYAALAWVPALVSAAVVSVRTYVRVKTHAVGPDDVLMVTAAVCFLSYAALAQAQFAASPVTTLDELRVTTISTIASIMGTLSPHFGRTSVGILQIRLFGPTTRWRRWFIYTTLAILQVLTFLIVVGIFFPQCSAEITDDDLDFLTGCIPPATQLGFVQTWNFYSAFVDLAFSTLPATIIYQLNMSANRKMALCTLLGLGWIASIFLFILAGSVYADWSEYTTNAVVPVASALENALVIICGSLVTLMPLYKYWTTGAPIRPYRSAQTPAYNAETKAPFLPRIDNSVSTVSGGGGAGQPLRQKASYDTQGIHVQRDFDVTSDYQNPKSA